MRDSCKSVRCSLQKRKYLEVQRMLSAKSILTIHLKRQSDEYRNEQPSPEMPQEGRTDCHPERGRLKFIQIEDPRDEDDQKEDRSGEMPGDVEYLGMSLLQLVRVMAIALMRTDLILLSIEFLLP